MGLFGTRFTQTCFVLTGTKYSLSPYFLLSSLSVADCALEMWPSAISTLQIEARRAGSIKWLLLWVNPDIFQHPAAFICVMLETEWIKVTKFSRAFFCFRIPHPFLSKCMLRMRKRRKSNLIWIFLWRTKVSEAVCKCDWHNVRSNLFLMCENFGLGVQWP